MARSQMGHKHSKHAWDARSSPVQTAARTCQSIINKVHRVGRPHKQALYTQKVNGVKMDAGQNYFLVLKR